MLPMVELTVFALGILLTDLWTPREWKSINPACAFAGVAFSAGGIKFSREIFASHPDQVVVVRLGSSTPGRVSLAISIDPGDLPGELLVDNQTL